MKQQRLWLSMSLYHIYLKHTHGFVILFFWGITIGLPETDVINLPIFFRATTLALVQSYDCLSASEVILKDVA